MSANRPPSLVAVSEWFAAEAAARRRGAVAAAASVFDPAPVPASDGLGAGAACAAAGVGGVDCESPDTVVDPRLAELYDPLDDDVADAPDVADDELDELELSAYA